MTTMASDSGCSSSSEPDDEPLYRVFDEAKVSSSSSSDNGSSDADSQSRDTSPDQEPPTAVTMTARAYQLEMLEESLKQNIIVAVCWPSVLHSAHSADSLPDGHRERKDAGVSGSLLSARAMLIPVPAPSSGSRKSSNGTTRSVRVKPPSAIN